MKDLKRAVLITIILVSGFLSGCSSWSRMGKSISSDMKGGLNRTVTLYDYNGEEIRHWSGKFDVYFDDQNGKRIIIHGGIIVNEEN
mgnify:CR=1 FL=1